MIRLELRGKAYGDAPVLGPIALELDAGERMAVLGPSGAGKSTLLRVLAGLDTEFDGTCARPGRIAMVFQEPTLLRWRSVSDNIALATGADTQRIAAALEAVGLSGHAGQFPGRLSLGQQRRAALARAMAAKPELLLLDEPFASLDAELADGMRVLVNDLIGTNGMAVVLVTHAPEDAAAIGAKVYRLGGSPATLSAQ